MARTPTAAGKATTSSDVDGILDAFLLDMSALDCNKHLSTNARSEAVSPQPTKRKATSTSDANTRTASKKTRLNPSWLKRKCELEDLRTQAQELKTQKELLLSKVPRVSTIETSKLHKSEKEEAEELEAALDENKNLKKKIRNLSVTVQSTICTEQLQSLALDVLRAAAARTLGISSPSVFDVLEARVNARFLQYEASLSAKQRVAIPNTTFVQTYNRSGDNCGSGVVEFKSTQLLPFAESVISSTVWSFVEFGGFPGDHELRVTKRSENTCAVDSQIILRLENSSLVVRNGHSVVKRFKTPNGIVLMSESVDHWATDCDKAGTGVHTIEGRSRFLISNYTRGKSAADSDISEIQAEVALTLDADSGIGHRKQNAEAQEFNAIVIPKLREIMESRRQFVENVLFDRIRAGE